MEKELIAEARRCADHDRRREQGEGYAELLTRLADALEKRPAEAIVALMNELLEMDPVAVSALCHVRVPCNETLAAHPKVQVALLRDPAEAGSNGDEYSVGLLGVLNGLGGADYLGRGAIAAYFGDEAVFDDPGNPPRVQRFAVLDRDVG